MFSKKRFPFLFLFTLGQNQDRRSRSRTQFFFDVFGKNQETKQYDYIWFDTNFEIIREEYSYFLKRNKIVAELGRKKIKK
jgi:hypothetical protein